MREPVGERGTVVEDELLVGRATLDGAFEGLLGGPALQERTFDGREVRPRRHVRVGQARAGGRVGELGLVGHLLGRLIVGRRAGRPAELIKSSGDAPALPSR